MIDSRLQAYRKANEDAPWEVLYFSPEWQPYIDLVSHWCKVPVTEETGLSLAAIDHIANDTAMPLPVVYREWLRLTGKHPWLSANVNQDTIVSTFTHLVSDWGGQKLLSVYGENQGNWTMGFVWEHEQPMFVMNFDFFGDAVTLGRRLPGKGHYYQVGDHFPFIACHLFARHMINGLRPDVLHDEVMHWVPYQFGDTEADYLALCRAWQLRDRHPLQPTEFWAHIADDYLFGPQTLFGVAAHTDDAWQAFVSFANARGITVDLDVD